MRRGASTKRSSSASAATLNVRRTADTGEPEMRFEMLRTKHNEKVQFTSVNGAQYHCGPMAPQVVDEACWDWLDDTIGRRPATSSP
jgi:hypothetical protein